MCYYNGQKVSHDEWIRLKHLEKMVSKYEFFDRPAPESDGFKYLYTAVLKRMEGVEDFEIVGMEWGFIPPYWKNREEVSQNRRGFVHPTTQKFTQYLTLNAKSEEMLLPNKMYRDAALKRRCLVISSGFVETMHYHGKNKRTGEPLKTVSRQPHYVRVKDKPYFFMAGIWQAWEDQVSHEKVETVSIVTTTAVGNRLMEQVHNEKLRMPTILNEDLAWEWMFGELSEERITEIARTQFPAELMEACPIERGYKESENPFVEFKHEGAPELVL